MSASVLSPISIPILNDQGMLTEDQIRSYHANGFVSMDRLADADEVATVRSILEELVTKKVGANEGSQYDTLASEEQNGAQKSVEISGPMSYAPALRNLALLHNATALARQILGEGAKLSGDFLLLKPAKSGTGTPWHQDEAYRDPRFIHKEMTVWIPLQEVSEQNGCMVFVPGSHTRGIYRHQSPGNDKRVPALECPEAANMPNPVACPLPAGGCTLHDGETLHCTTNNLSASPRYAYILVFHVPPMLAKEAKSFPWLDEKQSLQREQKRAWMLRGGVFVMVWRRIRRRGLWDMSGLRYDIQRVLNALHKH